MFERQINVQIQKAARTFYAVSLVGPRQSGKTTLLQHLFPTYQYINLEEPDTRLKVESDPKTFFADKDKKWIIDEAQEYPELFSFLLGIIDNNKVKGQFILSGSQNFSLLEKISQSLAGRVAILELLPLNFTEFHSDKRFKKYNLWRILYEGSYPGPYHENIESPLWYKSYITTYLKRDVRQLVNVKDLSKFHLFLKLCAGRHGQLLNLSSLASDCGLSHTTISQWISILEASYVIFRLQPYYRNLNKRAIKSPKLYFYDSGLVCHLLGIESPEHLSLHASRGAIFEGYIIAEVIKNYYAMAKEAPIYFWKSRDSIEVDLIIEKGEQLFAIEIKSSATFSKSFLKQIKAWENTFKENTHSYIVYAGEESLNIQKTHLLSWKDVSQLA